MSRPRHLLPVVLVGLGFVSYARADFTPINATGLQNVLDGEYGAGNYVRIDDDVDQVWSTGSGASVRYLYEGGGNIYDFGYFAGQTGSEFIPLDRADRPAAPVSGNCSRSAALAAAVGIGRLQPQLLAHHAAVPLVFLPCRSERPRRGCGHDGHVPRYRRPLGRKLCHRL